MDGVEGGGPTHLDIITEVRALDRRLSNMEGGRAERDRAVDGRFDSGGERMARIEQRVGGLEVAVAETKVVVDAVRKTAESTDGKVDRLLAVMERGKGAAWAFARAWGGLVVLVGLAGSALAYVAAHWTSIRRLVGW